MLASFGIIIILLLVCDNIRRFIISQSTRLGIQNTFSEHILLDVVAAIEMCSVSLELGVVLKHYGYWYFAILLYLNILYQCLKWPHIHPPCPYFHIVNFVSGKSNASLLHVITRCSILMASGLSTYHLVSTSIWSFELVEQHVGRIKETSVEHCSVPGKNKTPLCLLILSEFLGVFILDLTINVGIVNNPFFQKRSPMISSFIIPGVVVFSVTMAMDISGGMFNPMLATVLVGGCDGHSLIEHVVIYWIASTMGAILADLANIKAYHFVYGDSLKIETKKKKN